MPCGYRRERRARSIAVLALSALALAGCTDGSPTKEPSPVASGASLDGQTVKVSGPFTGESAEKFVDAFAALEDETGIRVVYEGLESVDADLVERIALGAAPDIAVVRERSTLSAVVATGDAVALSPTDSFRVAQAWPATFAEVGQIDGVRFGVPLTVTAHGYIFYSPEQFDELDLEVPETWNDLVASSRTIEQETGSPPWCAGFASDTLPGELGADWIEDMVLRAAGPAAYDAWAAGDLAFTDAAVQGAFDQVERVLLDSELFGARMQDIAAANTTTPDQIAQLMVNGDCALTYQNADFASVLAATETTAGSTPSIAADGDLYGFLMPGESSTEQAMTGSATYAVSFNQVPATRRVMAYLASSEFADAIVAAGGFVSASSVVDPSSAPGEWEAAVIDLFQNDDVTVRYDATELMPTSAAGEALAAGVTSWVDGAVTTDVLEDIEAEVGG